MSRIGKKPVKVPSGVNVELSSSQLKISGSKSSLTLDVHPRVEVAYDDSSKEISISRKGDERFDRAMHGTTRALIANMVQGVTEGYKRTLQIYGTGYGVKVQGQQIELSVGFAKPASLKIPDGVQIDIEVPAARGNDTPAVFHVSGPDKCSVGQFASMVRKVRPPEPYKGKGIRYADEQITRKVGKAFGSA